MLHLPIMGGLGDAKRLRRQYNESRGIVQVIRTFRLPTRLLICAAALAGSASAAIVTVPGTASASALTVTCTGLTGNATTQKLTGCSGSGKAQTGTSGTSTASNKTIKWATGKTSVSTYTYTPGSDASCPAVTGYTKDLLENVKGKVTSGTATGLVGGSYKATVCVYKKGSTILIKNKGNVTI